MENPPASKTRTAQSYPSASRITGMSNKIMGNQRNKKTTQALTSKEERSIGLGIYIEGGPRGSSGSNSNSTNSSASTHKPETAAHETYEEKLSRYQKFFDNGPLMRCLDTEEDKERARDMLFNTLLTDVKQNPSDDKSYRGVVQIRTFWEEVRKQLMIDEDDSSSPRSNGGGGSSS
jgi:hypothetical protein